MEALIKSAQGDVLEYVQNSRPGITVSELLSELEIYFGAVEEPNILLKEFLAIKMKDKETITQLVSRMQRKARQCNEAQGFPVVGKKYLRMQLFDALPPHLQSQIRHQFDDLSIDYESLVMYARRIYASYHGDFDQSSRHRGKKEHHSKATLAEMSMDDLTSSLSQMVTAQVQSHMAEVMNHKIQPQQGSKSKSKSSKSSSGNSNPQNHQHSNSREFTRGGGSGGNRGGRGGRGGQNNSRRTPRVAPTPDEARVERNDIKCHTCGGAGHLSPECPSRRLPRENQGGSSNHHGEPRPATQTPREAQVAQAQPEIAEAQNENPDSGSDSDRQ